MGDLVGYARVSTAEQNLDSQIDALERAGCVRVFAEHVSGVKAARPQLDAALDYLRGGDTLTVVRLDRLGRRTKQLLELIDDLADRGVAFRSLSEGFDPSSPLGKALLTVAAAFAEMERGLNVERTHAGLAAARARGRKGGRKPKMTARKISVARDMYAEVGVDGRRVHTVQEIADTVGVARKTVYNYL